MKIEIELNEYISLKKDEALLWCLEAFGVDNWCGWDEARTEGNYDRDLIEKEIREEYEKTEPSS